MTLSILYLLCLFGLIVLFFIKPPIKDEYKRPLFIAHFILLALFTISIILWINSVKTVSFRGVWTDRIIVFCFFLSGPTIYVLYCNTLKNIYKIYFAFFFFNPIILFPFLVLPVPEVYYSDLNYSLRQGLGWLAPKHLVLIKKNGLIEKEISTNTDEISHGFTIVELKSVDTNAIVFIANLSDSLTHLTFRLKPAGNSGLFQKRMNEQLKVTTCPTQSYDGYAPKPIVPGKCFTDFSGFTDQNKKTN